jgi:hypothetical protein
VDNVLDRRSIVPPIYAKAFKREWSNHEGLPAVVELPGMARMHYACSSRSDLPTTLFDPSPLPSDYIFGPAIPPTLLPYILLSHSLQRLYRQEAVSRGTNLVAYVNSLVVYTTVAVRYILDPADCPSNHLAQLKELAGRVEKEKSKVKQKGTMVRRDFKMGSSDPTDGTKNVSAVDWSFLRFEQDLRPALE